MSHLLLFFLPLSSIDEASLEEFLLVLVSSKALATAWVKDLDGLERILAPATVLWLFSSSESLDDSYMLREAAGGESWLRQFLHKGMCRIIARNIGGYFNLVVQV